VSQSVTVTLLVYLPGIHEILCSENWVQLKFNSKIVFQKSVPLLAYLPGNHEILCCAKMSSAEIQLKKSFLKSVPGQGLITHLSATIHSLQTIFVKLLFSDEKKEVCCVVYKNLQKKPSKNWKLNQHQYEWTWPTGCPNGKG